MSTSLVWLLNKREQGNCYKPTATQDCFLDLAEDKAATCKLEEIQCQLPSSVRSTFLMAFSPNGRQVASTHGDHKIYICDVRTGQLLHTLEGHPRTPWCLAFHPSSNDILASGCLGGEVRVWDLHGGSEVWVVEQTSVITSIAFHPTDKVLVVATLNEIHFWDWSLPTPFATCKTHSDKEKVRFVKFDPLGTRLITGITNLPPENQRNQVIDSIFGPTFPRSAPSRTILSQRRSILSRLMSMYRHLEGLEEISRYTGESGSTSPTQDDMLQRARNYAEEVTAQQWHRQRVFNLDQVLSAGEQDDFEDEPVASTSTSIGSGRSVRSRGNDPLDSLPPLPTASVSNASSGRQSPSSVPSTSNATPSTESANMNADFWVTFHRLRFICSSLERRMQHQPSPFTPVTPTTFCPVNPASSLSSGEHRNETRDTGVERKDAGTQPGSPQPGTSDAGQENDRVPLRRLFSNLQSSRSTGSGSSRSPPLGLPLEGPLVGPLGDPLAGPLGEPLGGGSGGGLGLGDLPASADVSLSLVNLLTRLQHSLQSLSNAALTTAVAREQIQQVRTRISEILERLANVSGYRARLTNLRDQIYEAADRMAQRGEDNTPTQRWDLAYCLWLVEMSLQLTRQMQRILAADYRLTQLHLSTAMPPSYPPRPPPDDDDTGSPDALLGLTASDGRNSPSPNVQPSPGRLPNPFSQLRPRDSWLDRQTSPFFCRRQQSTGTQSEVAPSALRHTRPSVSSQDDCLFDGPGASRHNIALRHFSSGSAFGASTRRSHNETSTGPAGRSSSSSFQNSSRSTQGQPSQGSRAATRLTRRRRWLNYRSSPFTRRRIRSSFASSSRSTHFSDLHRPSDSSSDDSTDQERNEDWDQPSTSGMQSGRRTGVRRFMIPSVQIDPSSPPQESLPLPPEERPRSPPLSAILSGAEVGHNTSGRVPASYFPLLYESSIRPRARVMLGIESTQNLTHRIQCWDFSKFNIPNISDAESSIVVPKCKIHNDASVDISRDGELLAALVPNAGGLTQLVMLAVYSLRPATLGQCLYTWSFGPNAISVSLSPAGRYVIVGLASSRISLGAPEKETVAQIFRLDPCTKSSSLTYVSSMYQEGCTQQSQISLNSVRWLPRSGQGLIYGTNRGLLLICRPISCPNQDISCQKNKCLSNVQILVGRRSLHLSSTATQTVQPDTQTTGTQTPAMAD